MGKTKEIAAMAKEWKKEEKAAKNNWIEKQRALNDPHYLPKQKKLQSASQTLEVSLGANQMISPT